MSKAIQGAALLAGAAGMMFLSFFTAGLTSIVAYDLMVAFAAGSVAMEAGAIASALTSNRGVGITTRQPASFRQIIYGEQRVGGIMVYESTTGSHRDQYNMIIVIATHEIDSIVNLYLDGRQVHWASPGHPGNVTRNGVNFGGAADGGTFIGPGGQNYNFDTLVYCEARFGDQSDGDVMSSMTANDPTWTTTNSGSPYVGGCAYVYLKVEYDTSMFPQFPEVKFTVRGKNNIRDPRLTPSTPATAPTVLARPTTLTNGWAGNAQEAAYEEGVDQGYGWGLNSASTPGYNTPNNVFDNNLTTSANVILTGTHTYAGCIWSFAALTGGTPTHLWLNVNSMVNPYSYTGRSAGIWFSIDAGVSWTQIYNSPNHAQLWDCIELSPTQDTSLVRVMAFTDAHDDMGHFVFEIQLATGQQANFVFDAQADHIFTSNWALVAADVIEDDQWGLGDIGSVNDDQLIAAANVCDEQITLAAGGTEAQWSCNWHYDTGTGPGDVLSTMMPAAAGRLSRIGGEWFIWPSYWQGPTFTFDESALTGGVKWSPFRKQRDLFNRVNGTYIAPNFPYNVAGNLYDGNGWYDGTTQNNFPFAFQPTNYPQYAADALHGYGVDIFLAQDGGIQLPKELVQNCVLSVTQAQRAAKVTLLRNRQQGSGMLMMNLEAWKMQPLDVMQMTFSGQNWVEKQLEVVSTQLALDDSNHEAPVIRFQCGVQETEQSTYEWSTTEELTVYDVPANPLVGGTYTVPPPTSLTLLSDLTTALMALDGVLTPRILASWTPPGDVLVTQYQVQYKLHADTVWSTMPTVDFTVFQTLITGVVAGAVYDVRVQAMRPNGAQSTWLEIDSFTASVVYSQISSTGINPNSPYNISNDATIDSVVSGSDSHIRVYGPGGVGTTWDLLVGNTSTAKAATTITGAACATLYYILLDDVGDYHAVTDYNDTLADNVIIVGSLVTISTDGTGGTRGGGSGGGAGGPRNPLGCTLEGTELDTPNGPLDNRIIKQMFDAGEPIYLMGRNQPERVIGAQWIDVNELYRVSVNGHESFECSASHVLDVDGVYTWVSRLAPECTVNTRHEGKQNMQYEVLAKTDRVLRIELSGPSHEYSVHGVMTHNFKIT